MTSQGFSQDFNSLVELGKIIDEMTWCGHVFEMKTLSVEEELINTRIISYYKGTAGEDRAAAAAQVAASLFSINGVPFYPDVFGDSSLEANIKLRFSKVIKWPYSLVEALFLFQLELLQRSNDTIQELKKKPLNQEEADLDDIARVLSGEGSFPEDG